MEYKSRFAELTSLGFGLLAVSVDDPARSRDVADRLGLPFPLLSDTQREVIQAYGVHNREEKGGIAYPATFVLDRDRAVRFRSLDRTATRVDLDGLFAFLRSGMREPPPAEPPRKTVRTGIGDFGRAIASAIRHGVRSPR